MMSDTEGVFGSLVGKNVSLSEVNQNALNRLNELITVATPEEIPGLIESLAKYNASLRNNSILDEKDDEEKINGARTAQMAEILKG